MSIRDFITLKMSAAEFREISGISSEADKIIVQMLAVKSAIAKISTAVSKCEFCFSSNDKLITGGEDWYTWNVSPNNNQNKSQFIYDLISEMALNGKALCINSKNEYFIAERFSDNRDSAGFDLSEFWDIEKNGVKLQKKYKANQIMLFSFNDEKVRQLIDSTLSGYTDLLSAAASSYKKSAFHKGLLKLGAAPGGNPEKEQKEIEEINKNFTAFFKSQNAVMPLRKGYDYEEIGKYAQKESAEDIPRLTKEIYARVAESFEMPVGILMGNEAESEKSRGLFYYDCVKKYTTQIESELNRKEIGRKQFVNNKNKMFISMPPDADDLIKNADKIYNLLGSGALSIDEIRVKKGMVPLNTEWSRAHFISKNFIKIEDVEKVGDEK